MTDEPQRMDAPNQQAVRADQSGPADVGEGGPARAATPGGSMYGETETQASAPTSAELDAMTKDQLLAEAARRGVPVDASMTKAEIREALGA